MRNFPVFVTVVVKVLWDQAELISYEATSINYYVCVCLCLYLCIPPAYFIISSPYYVTICGVLFCAIFSPHYFINDKIFGNSLFNINFCLDFFYKLVWNTSHSKKYSAICYINVRRSSCKLSIILVIFKWNFSQQAWQNRKLQNIIKFRPLLSRVVAYGQTDGQETDWRTNRHDETNIRVSQFCDNTKK